MFSNIATTYVVGIVNEDVSVWRTRKTAPHIIGCFVFFCLTPPFRNYFFLIKLNFLIMVTNQIMKRKMGDFEVTQYTKDECIISFLEGNDYLVKSNGDIISLNYNRTGKPKLLKQRKDKDGYKIVTLFYNKKSWATKVHRIVAICFIPNINSLPMINHIDENKENNNVNNLEWCDCKYNLNYGSRNIKVSKSMTNGKTSKKVAQIDLQGNLIKVWDSINEAQRHGYSQAHISKVASLENKYSKYKTHKGFIWRFI